MLQQNNKNTAIRVLAGVVVCVVIAGCGSSGETTTTTGAAAAPAVTTPATTATAPATTNPATPAPSSKPAAKAKAKAKTKPKPALRPTAVVTKVGNRTITKAMVDRSVIVAEKAAGKGGPVILTDSPKFTKCVAGIERQLAPQEKKTSPKVLRKRCAQQYASQVPAVMTTLITASQTEQDAEIAGITVSNAEISKYKAQQRESLANSQQSSGETPPSAPTDTASVRIQLLTQKLEQHRMKADSPQISEAQIKAYYDEHKPQYATEERRDVQIEAAKTKAAAEVVKRKLAKSKPVASDNMGRAGEPGVLGKLIFSLSEGKVGGPVYMDKYWYVVRVVNISSAGTKPFAQQRAEIREQLQSKVATPKVAKAQQQLTTTWKARTICRAGYVVELCSNS